MYDSVLSSSWFDGLSGCMKRTQLASIARHKISSNDMGFLRVEFSKSQFSLNWLPSIDETPADLAIMPSIVCYFNLFVQFVGYMNSNLSFYSYMLLRYSF